MPAHIGYFTDSHGSQPWFRCVQCHYDTFVLGNMLVHATQHPQIQIADDPAPLRGDVSLAMSLLTWNTAEASVKSAAALCAEQERLKTLGVQSVIFWFDNGSTDGTIEAISPIFKAWGAEFACWLQPSNIGQCRARNQLIDWALGCDVKYLLMVDGDIEIIPYSAYALVELMERSSPTVGCLGLNCRNCTPTREAEVALACKRIDWWMCRPAPHIAWTQYGLFRREVLEKCRFETEGPFAGPGWGWEDDDYALQMTVQGFTCWNTPYFRYLHRHRHSSIEVLGKSLAAKVYGERKAKILAKWRETERVQSHLARLENQQFPLDC